MVTRFHYSNASVMASIRAAGGLTAIVTFLVWLFSRLAGLAQPTLIALAAAVIFFAFCSAAMVWRAARGAVVLAARPDGLFDARIGTQAVPWPEIREIALARAENEFSLAVRLWPTARRGDFEIDLAPLDGDLGSVIEAINAYHQVRIDGV